MVRVHSEEACGSDFSELAHDLTSYFKLNSVKRLLERVNQCKAARLEESAKIGNINQSHIYAYNLIEYLHDCIDEIATYRIESLSIMYKKRPMSFQMKVGGQKGERVYTITPRGYTFIDKHYE